VQYQVFAQANAPRLDFPQILVNARLHFAAGVCVLGEEGFEPGGSEPQGTRAWLELTAEQYGILQRFWITVRKVQAEDLARAQTAELAGKAGGMAALAARCPFVWELAAQEPGSELGTLLLCAILASVALGPVLPGDNSSLFGVRGALLRLEKLAGRRPSP
jgi:hypothetical protein